MPEAFNETAIRQKIVVGNWKMYANAAEAKLEGILIMKPTAEQLRLPKHE